MCSDAEGAPEKRARHRDIAFANEFANATARHAVAAQAHLGIGNNGESRLFTKLGEFFEVSFRLVSEVKIKAFVHFFGVQLLAQNLGELFWSGFRELPRKRKYKNRIYCCRSQEL